MEMDARLVALDSQAEMEFVTRAMQEVKHYDGVKWWTGGIPVAKHWVWSQEYLKFKGKSEFFYS